MPKRATVIMHKAGDDFKGGRDASRTVLRRLEIPKDLKPDFDEWGLPTKADLGRKELEKLGWPEKVRVTFTVVE